MLHDVIDEQGNTVPVEETVKATFVYDAFNTRDRETVDIDWSADKSVLDYIGELPTDVSYGYATDKRGVLKEDELAVTKLSPNEHLIVTVVPQGGKIAMLVGMVIAVAVAAVFTAGAAGAFGGTALAGMFAGGGAGLWVGAAVAWIGAISTITQGVMSMTQKQSKVDSSASYGIDGPKATNDETTPVPYVYGTMRVAGNKVNVFNENVTTKRQKMYVQFVVSEGPVQAITDIEVNEQSVDKYNNVTSSNKDNDDADDDGLVIKTDVRLGTDTQDVMPWFSSSLSQYNVQAHLNQDYATYTTQEAVNRIRLDFAFPNGLYHVTSKKGKYVKSTVPITAEYAPAGSDDWTSFAHDYEWSAIDYENNFTDIAVKGLRITVMMVGKDGEQSTAYNAQVQYRKATAANNTDTSTPWSTMGSDSGSVTNTMLYENGNPVFKAGTLYKTFEVSGLDESTYSFQTSGCVIVGVEAFYKQDLSWSLCTTTEYRMSIMSPPLPLGTYQVRVKRENAESTESDTSNALYLMDITQYQDNPVAYNNTAYYGAQIKLGTEISGEPTITALVQGRLVNIYDREGNITDFRWSDNPADVALDILLNTNNNFGISPTRVDFAGFDDWRQFCTANNLAFNGIFDTLTNAWDAVAQVTRVGRAGISLDGLSWTVVIEQPADPVMMFGQANIVKGSLTIQWTGRKDRPNLYEIQYYDKNDDYKQHSAFAMDDTFITNGDALVQKTVNLIGVTDATQAQNEAWLMLNLSRYINQVCSFEVPYQAVGVAVGDVFLLQHDIVDWGNEARVKSVNGNNITLDKIDGDTSLSWNLFLIQSLTNVAAGVITDCSGRDIVIQTLTAPIWTDADKNKPYYNSDQVVLNGNTDYMSVVESSDCQRIVINGTEYGVEDRTIVGSEIHFTLDVAPGSVTGQNAQIFNIDALCQAPLTYVSDGENDTQNWTVGAWENGRNATISVGARVLLGTSSVKAKPFRCTKITYKDDHTRTIAGAEYNESIYTANPLPAPNYSGLTEEPSQCSNLAYALGNSVSQNGSLSYYADISWTRPISDQRVYQSARVFVNRNYEGFVLEQEVPNPTQTLRINADLGDIIQVRVQAVYANGVMASYTSAPMITFEVVSETMVPDNIDNTTLKAVGGIRLISLTWEALNEPYIASYEIYESASDDITKGYRVYIGDANYFNRTGLDPNTTAYYWIRTVSTAGTVSAWSTSVSATTSYVLTSDLEAEIANTAKIAQQLLKNIGTPTAVEASSVPDAATYPNGAYISYSTDGTNAVLLKNENGTWVSVVGNVTVNADGTITESALPILSSDKVTQQLAQNQIDILNKAAEDSSLTADQKSEIAAAVAAGKATQSVINVAQQALSNVTVTNAVDNLSFSNIKGQITSDQVASLQAAKIAGQLTSDQIQSINSSKIEGQIVASQIASIQASQISTQLTSDQIQGLETAKLTGQITNTQITDNAITTSKISAGAVVTASIATGAITAEKIDIGNTRNLLSNTTFPALSTYDWYCDKPGWWFGGYINAKTSSNLEQNYLLGYTDNEDNTAWNRYTSSRTIPCVPGQRYEFSAYVACYNANPSSDAARLELFFFDANGNSVGNETVYITTSTAAVPSNPALSDLQRVGGFATAPSNAATVKMWLMTWGGKDSSGNVTATSSIIYLPLIGEATPNQTVLSNWSPGGVTTIDGSQINTQSIKAAQIAANTITSAQIDADSIRAAVLTANCINANNIASNAITTDKISAGAVTTTQIASQTIIGDNIAGNTIKASNLVVSDVSAAILTANSITTNMLSSGVVTGDKIDAQSVSAKILVSNSIYGDMIAANTIDASKIDANSIRAAVLTAGSITTNMISSGAVTGDSIAGNTITGNNIAGSAITADKLAVGSPNNLIQNSCFDPDGAGVTEWVAWTDNGVASQAIALYPNDSSWSSSPSSNSCGWLCVSAYGSLDNESRIAANPLNIQTGDNKLPATPNTSYCFSIYAGPNAFHTRCTMGFYDENGNQLAFGTGAYFTCNGNAKDISTYARPFIIATAPSGTAFVAVWVECWNLTGSTMYNGPGVALTQAQLAIVPSGATQPPAWCSGLQTTINGAGIKSGTITADKIRANSITSAQIQSGAIGADQIAANSITSGQLATTNLIVQSAQIANLVVGTEHMQDNSITTFATAYFSTQTYGNGIGNFTQVAELTFNVDESRYGVLVLGTNQGRNKEDSVVYRYQILQNGNVILDKTSQDGQSFITIVCPLGVSAGSTTIAVNWSGQDSHVNVSGISVTALVRAK